ncbi:MAG: hypothetical protein J6H18_05185 [Lachnospiraceae bacterium]|nr:hypothetical protein [Lachnospiraceae bacterium]
MKRVVITLCAGLLLLGLVACQGNTVTQSTSETLISTGITSAEKEQESSEPTASRGGEFSAEWETISSPTGKGLSWHLIYEPWVEQSLSETGAKELSKEELNRLNAFIQEDGSFGALIMSSDFPDARRIDFASLLYSYKAEELSLEEKWLLYNPAEGSWEDYIQRSDGCVRANPPNSGGNR